MRRNCTSCTYCQNRGHCPGRYPPLPPSLPAFCQVLRYGDLTASGRAGGRAGVKVDWAPMEVTKEATSRPRRDSMLTGAGDCRKGLDESTFNPGACPLYCKSRVLREKYLSKQTKTEDFPKTKQQQCRAMMAQTQEGIDAVFTGMPRTFL